VLPDEAQRSARIWVRRRFERIFLRLYGGPGGRLSAEGSVLRASVLGGRTGLAPADERALVASGVYHILAVSGLQVAVLAGAVLLILQRTPLPLWAALALVALAAAFYGEVVAPSASVRRAVVMAALAAASRLARRRTRPLALLAATALGLLCLRPSELADPGFQLTFSATAGILLFSDRLAAHLPARWGLSSLLAASLAAQGATWPLVALWFHRVVPYGLASNLLAVPLGSAAVVLGILLLPADLVGEPLSTAVGSLAQLAVNGLLAVAKVPVEGTFLSFRVPEPTAAALAMAFGGLFVLALSRRARALAAGGAALLAAAFLLTVADPLPREDARGIPPADPRLTERGGLGLEERPAQAVPEQGAPPERRRTPLSGGTTEALLTIDVLDVGQGDAILVGFPDGETMLVDGGGFPGSSFDIGERVLVPELERRGLRRIGRIVLTHAHEDHGGGLREVLRDLSAGELLSPDTPEGPLRDELEGIARKNGTRVLRIRRGYIIREGDTTIECLSPFAGGMDDPNADSVVLRVSHGSGSALLTGDIGAASERKLVSSRLARADFLKVAHHGSAGSTTLALLQALAPRVAVISVGASNRFGHPSPEVLRRLSSARALVFRTDRDGAVRLAAGEDRLYAGTLMEDRAMAFPGPPLRARSASATPLRE